MATERGRGWGDDGGEDGREDGGEEGGEEVGEDGGEWGGLHSNFPSNCQVSLCSTSATAMCEITLMHGHSPDDRTRSSAAAVRTVQKPEQ